MLGEVPLKIWMRNGGIPMTQPPFLQDSWNFDPYSSVYTETETVFGDDFGGIWSAREWDIYRVVPQVVKAKLVQISPDKSNL